MYFASPLCIRDAMNETYHSLFCNLISNHLNQEYCIQGCIHSCFWSYGDKCIVSGCIMSTYLRRKKGVCHKPKMDKRLVIFFIYSLRPSDAYINLRIVLPLVYVMVHDLFWVKPLLNQCYVIVKLGPYEQNSVKFEINGKFFHNKNGFDNVCQILPISSRDQWIKFTWC